MSLLPGEQEALQQSAVAGGPGIKTHKQLTTSSTGGPTATSTPASIKKHAQQVRLKF